MIFERLARDGHCAEFSRTDKVKDLYAKMTHEQNDDDDDDDYHVTEPVMGDGGNHVHISCSFLDSKRGLSHRP